MRYNYLRGNESSRRQWDDWQVTESAGDILKSWRRQRRYSQLKLALELDISSKHISFIETGKSIPSKEMILKIGEFLFIPKREVNRILLSAGYAPVYSELPMSDAALEPVTSAIDQMIENHMPYPAIVLNQTWDIVKVNDSASRLLSELGLSGHKNLLEAIIQEDPESSRILNFHQTATMILLRLRQEISMLGGPAYLKAFERRLKERLFKDKKVIGLPETEDGIVLSTQFQLSNHRLSFFSMIAQLGTVQDIVVGEFKVELMFPADEKTKEFYSEAYKESV